MKRTTNVGDIKDDYQLISLNEIQTGDQKEEIEIQGVSECGV